MINLNVGQKIIFREDFQYQFGGATSYSYENSFISNTPTFSLYLIATPMVDSSRHVMFSFGSFNAGTVLFEVGISTNDKLFVYDGTTETEVGDALASDVLYNITAVYSNNLLTVYINNTPYVTGVGIGTIEGIDFVIGDSIVSGDYYEGYLNNVVLFVENHSRAVVQTITN